MTSPVRRILYRDTALADGDPLCDPAGLWRVWRVSWAADPVVV